jgi:acetylornithine deacetylase/succinyl-diaminopimelate desuccinylase-like protein
MSAHPGIPYPSSRREWLAKAALCGIALVLPLLGCAARVQENGQSPGTATGSVLGERAARILGDAIRFRTVNPPGDEAPLAAYLAELLEESGIDARVIPTPSGRSKVGRAAVWARLRGTGSLRPIVLLSHLDVVPASARDGWDADPFAGARRGGEILGRGALDAKGVAVVHLLALSELARRKTPLARDVILLATPDEETGGLDGAGWIVRERPQLIQGAEYLLTEGGGVHIDPAGGPDTWQVAVSEKSPCWLRISTHGRSGHASVPDPDAAVGRLLSALERIRRRESPLHVVPEVARMFRDLAPLAPAEDAAGFADLAEALAFDPRFRERFLAEPAYAALVRDSLAITVLRSGQRTNVVPARATAHLDARLLPGALCEDFSGEIAELTADLGAEVETLLSFRSATSPIGTDLYRAIESAARLHDPRAIVVPRVLAGFTDAHYFRELGITSYGFVPRWQRRGEQRGVHGPNERISVANLQRGVETLVAILEELDRDENERSPSG